jgi:beta-glucosidase
MVSLSVRNAGSNAGTAVPQVYVGAPFNKAPGIQYADKSLAQFSRVTLASGARAIVTLHIASRAFEHWSTNAQTWVRDPGARVLYAGSSSRDLPLTKIVNIPAI